MTDEQIIKKWENQYPYEFWVERRMVGDEERVFICTNQKLREDIPSSRAHA